MPETKTLTPAMEKELREYTSHFGGHRYLPAALATIEQLRGRVRELEKALKPFVDDFTEEYGSNPNWRAINGEMDLALDVQVKHWKRAVAALNPEKEASHEPKA